MALEILGSGLEALMVAQLEVLMVTELEVLMRCNLF